MRISTAVILIILVIFGIACLQPVFADEQGADLNATSPDDIVAGSEDMTYAANAIVAATTATTAPTPTPYVPSGSIQVSSNPTGATVWVDGVSSGMTPIVVTGLTQGTHNIEVEKTGYQHWESQVYVQVGATTNVFAGLVVGTSPTVSPTTTTTTTTVPTTGPTTNPTPAFGNLQIVSDPQAAKIYIDDAYRGITPGIISDITTGYHLVRLDKTGYHTWTDNQVYVWGGETSQVLATLIPDDVTVTPTGTTTATVTATATANPHHDHHPGEQLYRFRDIRDLFHPCERLDLHRFRL